MELMKHCLGLDHKKPYKRHGKYFYKPYRNYFSTSKNSSLTEFWENLYKKGYADKASGQNCHGGHTYWLTWNGMAYLGEQLNIHIYPEEE